MKSFDIPVHFKSSFIGKIKELRKNSDPRKKDFTPTLLDFGPVKFYMARHFGFCYGVENAIEISYKALEENKGKRIFLLSQMIHNPDVNADLQSHGIQFIMDTEGKQFINWENITSQDVVIIPAFGTTLEIEKLLLEKNVQIEKYNTTCPFVERVWNKAEKLGKEAYTIIIHGKASHEETRATFSHSRKYAKSIVIRNMDEAKKIAAFIRGEMSKSDFLKNFGDKISEGFDPDKDLKRVGVINQTTMLADETQAIAQYFKDVMLAKYPGEAVDSHFSDTRDTLCYATNDNQTATRALLEVPADLALIVGGYNSSNTSHLVEMLEQKFPSYFICNETEIINQKEIQHFNYPDKKLQKTNDFIPKKEHVRIILTSGASCPDTTLELVMDKILSFFPLVKTKEQVLEALGEGN
ncbi:MAG: 4-hydroxy-3-methylbut-2-enyl diphosphate reductase [Flavobacteriales bacterium]